MARSLIATALAVLLIGFPSAGVVSAAEEDLRLQADATYSVYVDRPEVRVVVDWRATVLKPDTARSRSYMDRLIFPVPLEATDLQADSDGTRLRTSVRDTKDLRVVTVRFPPLFSKQSRDIRVEFTLPAGRPRSDSDIRVGAAFITFTPWAWGDPGRSSVGIALPSGFVEDGFGDPLTPSTGTGPIDLTSGPIGKPDEWSHVVVATHSAGLTFDRVTTRDRTVVVRSWPEDLTWRDRVAARMRDGLPLLSDLIGLPWPLEKELWIVEEHTPLLEGYSAYFDEATGRITMGEDLDDQTILHEASHAWFNGGLAKERWILEGLADHFADRAREELDLPEAFDPLLVSASDEDAFPLNSWEDSSDLETEEEQAHELYGYDASYTVIRAIARDIGEEGMRDVLEAAYRQDMAYEGDRGTEPSGAIPDWRQFLDLVEEIGGMATADELFRRYVLTASQLKELDARDRARAEYDRLDATGDDWGVPKGVRTAMGSWRFTQAEALMDAAEPALAARDTAFAAAAEVDVTPPQAFETTFEEAERGDQLDPLIRELKTWGSAAVSVSEARDAVAAPRTPLVALGLVGDPPETQLEMARAALGEGDAAAATTAATATIALLGAAEAAGTTRALALAIIAVVAVLLMVALIAVWWHRQRLHRRRVLAASVGASTTLAPSPEPQGARPEVPSTPD